MLTDSTVRTAEKRRQHKVPNASRDFARWQSCCYELETHPSLGRGSPRNLTVHICGWGSFEGGAILYTAMERQTLWRANVATATRTRDGRKQSYRGMGSSETTSRRNKQSLVFQYPTSGLTHPSRPISSLSQRTKPSPKAGKLPTRAHSSLGFTWSSQSVSKHQLSQPQGFDLAGYVKKQGSATEIRIGVNGETTNDDYFRNYLKECEKQLENASPLSSDDDSISTFEGDISEGILISQNTRKPQKHVPLCWKDQFQKAEVKMYQSITIIVFGVLSLLCNLYSPT